MLIGFLLVVTLLAALALFAQRRGATGVHGQAGREAWRQARPLLVRLPVALVAASLLAALVPATWVARVFGEASGASGILAASVLGAVLPGGPMVAFPLAVAVFEAGAGPAQMVALITAWSVLALHRVIAFEIPTAGAAFAGGRLAASLLLPVLAGTLAAGVLTLVSP